MNMLINSDNNKVNTAFTNKKEEPSKNIQSTNIKRNYDTANLGETHSNSLSIDKLIEENAVIVLGNPPIFTNLK